MWLALVDERPTDSAACAAAGDPDGSSAGFLAAWSKRADRSRPTAHARRVDSRLVDPEGAPAWVSLVLPPPGVQVIFDDPVVQQARRAVLGAARPADALSTLLLGDSVFEGAVRVSFADDRTALGDDPFDRVFPARVLRVGPGLFAPVPAPAGPCIERYGSARPWPWDRFSDPA